MMVNPRISCILTAHNKESMIEDVCLGIINNISELTHEIIIVLDGCTDNTEKIIRNTIGEHSIDVKYIYTDDVFELKANNEG